MILCLSPPSEARGEGSTRISNYPFNRDAREPVIEAAVDLGRILGHLKATLACNR